MKTFKVISMVCLAVAAFFACTPINHAGTATQTGNPTIAGVLYAPGGKAPAVHATVHIRKKSALADTTGSGLGKILVDTATVTTNDSGVFHIDSIDTGTYVIEGANGNNLALIDSVPVKNKDSTVILPPDTLKPAGAIKGVIRLSEGGDPRKVFILAFGIDRFARVNVDGSFKFSILAEGKYGLRLISSLDNYGVLDTVNIPVKSGDTLNMDTIDLPFTGIPTPKNVTIAYDTLKQIVALGWDKPDSALVKGFNVYRRNVDSNTVLARINTSPITDTIYKDSTGIQDQTYEYRIACVDKNATEGTKSAGVSVKVVGAFVLIDTIGNGEGSGNGKFSGLVGIAIDSKGNIFAVNNGYNEVQKFDSVGNYISKIGEVFGSDTAQFHYPTDVAADSLDNIYIGDAQNSRIQKFNKDGKFLLQWGTLGDSIGQFEEIYSVTVYKGFVYVGEKNGNRVQKFDLLGNHILTFNTSAPPRGVALNDNSIYIVSGGNKISQFGFDGNLAGDLYSPTKNPSITYPDGIQIADVAILDSFMLVLQPYDSKVVITDFNGKVISKFNIAQILPESWGERIEVKNNRSILVSTVRGFILKYVKK